jgi:two-component system cell cycle response regulator DivK
MADSSQTDASQPLPRVLIAEDENVGIYTFEMMLKHRYNLIFARNGREAVDMYFKENPDIVLMDIMMPEVNGYEALDEIRKRRSSDDIKIIAVTARAMPDEIEEILDYGFDDYISKPIDDDELNDKIRKHIRKLWKNI